MKPNDQNKHGEPERTQTERFEFRLMMTMKKLGLKDILDPVAVSQIRDAAYYAVLCNMASNGLGGRNGEIKNGREANRISRERAFMAAKQKVFRSAWCKDLPVQKRASVRNAFFSVSIAGDNLAG